MRKDDPGLAPRFRTDRFFTVSGRWYFTTREGEDFGPFENQDEANTRLVEYIATQSVLRRLRDSDPGLENNSPEATKHIAELARDIQKKRRGSQ